MANDFFSFADLVRLAKARAEDINSLKSAIVSAFDKLPTAATFKERRTMYALDTGSSANAYVVTLSPAPTSYVRGMTIDLDTARTNTGPATINANGLGVVQIVDGDGNALTGSEIVSAKTNRIVYDGSKFRLPGTVTSVVPGDGTVTALKFAATAMQTLYNNAANVALTTAQNIFNQSQVIAAASAGMILRGTSAGSNEKNWGFVSNLGNFYLQSYTDANAFGANAWQVTRSGTGVTSHIWTVGTSTITYNGGTIAVSGDSSTLALIASNAASGSRGWTMYSSLGVFFLGTGSDSGAPTNPAYTILRSGGTITGQNWFSNGVRALRLTTSGNLLVGDDAYTGTDPTDSGINLQGNATVNPGAISATTQSLATLFLNRQDGSGNLVEFYLAGTFQGAISGSGTTITYGSFCAAHWSQTADKSTPDILRGTIVETIDQMCEWLGVEYVDHRGATKIVEPKEGLHGYAAGDPYDVTYTMMQGEGEEASEVPFKATGTVVSLQNDQLPRFKVSETPASKAVYGVFMGWGASGEGETDAQIASGGAYVVRIGSGIVVACGDLIESAGDGTGRVQADDIMRASTVAKVTAAVPVETFDDGSYLVPCTLHCG